MTTKHINDVVVDVEDIDVAVIQSTLEDLRRVDVQQELYLELPVPELLPIPVSNSIEKEEEKESSYQIDFTVLNF